MMQILRSRCPGDFGGLSLTKLKYETLNQWNFCQIWMSSPPVDDFLATVLRWWLFGRCRESGEVDILLSTLFSEDIFLRSVQFAHRGKLFAASGATFPRQATGSVCRVVPVLQNLYTDVLPLMSSVHPVDTNSDAWPPTSVVSMLEIRFVRKLNHVCWIVIAFLRDLELLIHTLVCRDSSCKNVTDQQSGNAKQDNCSLEIVQTSLPVVLKQCLTFPVGCQVLYNLLYMRTINHFECGLTKM